MSVRVRDGLALLTTLRDVSARKQAELAQRRLRGAAAASVQDGGGWSARRGVAHDFNNLLTGIRGFTDILISGVSESDPAHGDLLEIQRATQRAATLTGQLLAFSRKQVVESVVVDLNQLISGAMRILERLIGEDVQVVFQARCNLRAVRVEPSGMEQVLINLAVQRARRDASRRAAQHRNLRGRGRRRAVSEPLGCPTRGGTCCCPVKDTGVGMSEGVMSRLFEPFFTTKGPGRGPASACRSSTESCSKVAVSCTSSRTWVKVPRFGSICPQCSKTGAPLGFRRAGSAEGQRNHSARRGTRYSCDRWSPNSCMARAIAC